MCGKYTKLEDSYASIIESFNHCSAHLECKINLKWIETTDLEDTSFMRKVDGIVVPGGFGSRGAEGKIEAIRIAREKNIPFLGLCLGLHMAVIEYARNVCGLEDANSTEMDSDTPHPVIDILPEQKKVTEKGGIDDTGRDPAQPPRVYRHPDPSGQYRQPVRSHGPAAVHRRCLPGLICLVFLAEPGRKNAGTGV